MSLRVVPQTSLNRSEKISLDTESVLRLGKDPQQAKEEAEFSQNPRGPTSIRNIVRAAPAANGKIHLFECLVSGVIRVPFQRGLIFEFNHKCIREWVRLVRRLGRTLAVLR
jgi:hypothetical protein